MSSEATIVDSTAHLTALRHAVIQEQARIDNIVDEKRKAIEEHRTLIKKLDDLPKKLRHDVMIPLGKVAFMPGRIVRTNEVVMLVGDGYFVERSCHEANQCLNRRIGVLSSVIDDCQKEMRLINDQMKYAEQLFTSKTGNEDGEVEINEPYDEEVEAEFRRKRHERSRNSAYNTSNSIDDDLMARLDRLQMEEAEKGELDEIPLCSKNMEPPRGVSERDFKRLLARLDDEDDTSNDELYSDEDDEDLVETTSEKVNIASVGNSDKTRKEEIDSDDLTEEEEEEKNSWIKEVPTKKKQEPERKKSFTFARRIEEVTEFSKDEPVTSIKPAPEYHSNHTASILVNKDTKSPCDEKAVAAIRKYEEVGRPRVLPGSQTAFSGQIVERQTLDFCTSEPSTSTGQKPISKFKRQRVNK